MKKISSILFPLAICAGITTSFSFKQSAYCGYPKLSRIFSNTEIFTGMGVIAHDQDIYSYEPMEEGDYFCVDDITVCTYYLDWDGWIKQCEKGMFVY